jgi:putative ABC transport system ATP-binding protein
METEMALIETRDLWKTYVMGSEEIHALRGVTIEIERGEYVAIMGPSGSGKSTLLHCLAGLDRPTSGSVVVAGVALENLTDTQLTVFRREQLGFVFQAFNLLPMLTAEQNIWLPLELAGRRDDGRAGQRFRVVTEVLGLTDRLAHRPAELSGGQQQRVAIARALVAQPALLFADEPTGNLDSEAAGEILGHLRASVRELGQTVVMVTHDLDAAAYADDVVVIADGNVRAHLAAPTLDELTAVLYAEPVGAVR